MGKSKNHSTFRYEEIRLGKSGKRSTAIRRQSSMFHCAVVRLLCRSGLIFQQHNIQQSTKPSDASNHHRMFPI
ncbi:hypothetical protein TNCV_37521 [Trichonephila clavipes]|nr:hypothetical protein TNCV_37521 [Trichonephila clavipes]